MKRTAPARLALDADLAVHQGDQARRDREAQPRTAIPAGGRIVFLLECLEDLLLLIERDADARVADGEAQHLRRAGSALGRLGLRAGAGRARLDADDHFALLGELDRVADEIEQDLPEPSGIADQGVGDVRLDLADQLQPFLVGAEGQGAQRLPQDAPQREPGVVELELAGLDLGEVEQVVDHVEQGIGRGLDDRQVLPLLVGARGFDGQLGHAEDGVHRRADLMADVGQELVLGPVRRLRRLLGLAAAPAGALLIIDVDA